MKWYEILTAIISLLSFLGFGTVIQMFLKDKHNQRKLNSEQEKARMRKERQEAIREVIREENETISISLSKIEDKLKLTSEGTQAGLRNDLLNCYYACSKKGYVTNEDIQNWQDLLVAYHNLGGNSFIDKLDKIMSELDTEEQFKAKKKAARRKKVA